MRHHRGRILLVLLTLYALAMIVPDLARIVRPLASFGVASDSNGVIYDVRSPFDRLDDSPAWRAGIRPGDRLDLARMRCIPVDTEICASTLAQWGGLNYVMPGRHATLLLAATPAHAAREVTLVAQQRDRSALRSFVVLLNALAGILVVLGAAWLVWTHPGGMTWGFFAYAIQFNPGQAFQFYAWLQLWPPALLVQNIGTCFLQAAGYTGFLLFALRVPGNRAEGGWQRVARVLPVLGALFLAISLASLGSVFGFPAEAAMRASVFIGFAVAVAALAILFGRRSGLPPRQYQRLRWVIWGCLIGLPTYLVAELSQETSLPSSLVGSGAPPEDLIGLLYLINGVLCLFVVEAVRRPTVVSVTIPLRRATVLGLLFSVPAFFLHEEIAQVDEIMHLPNWAWVLVASVFVFVISRLHEGATHLADHLFDLEFHRAEASLAETRRAILQAHTIEAIDRLLVEAPARALRLASAAVFREQSGTFRRAAGLGWDAEHRATLEITPALRAAFDHRRPFAFDASDGGTPTDLAQPILAVPVGNPRRCFAVVLYGDHLTGTDMDRAERDLLARLARDAAIAYAQVETELLQARIAALESQLAHARAAT